MLGPEVRPDGQPLETIQAEAHFPYTGREGGVMTANTGRGASVAIRIDDVPVWLSRLWIGGLHEREDAEESEDSEG